MFVYRIGLPRQIFGGQDRNNDGCRRHVLFCKIQASVLAVLLPTMAALWYVCNVGSFLKKLAKIHINFCNFGHFLQSNPKKAFRITEYFSSWEFRDMSISIMSSITDFPLCLAVEDFLTSRWVVAYTHWINVWVDPLILPLKVTQILEGMRKILVELRILKCFDPLGWTNCLWF